MTALTCCVKDVEAMQLLGTPDFVTSAEVADRARVLIASATPGFERVVGALLEPAPCEIARIEPAAMSVDLIAMHQPHLVILHMPTPSAEIATLCEQIKADRATRMTAIVVAADRYDCGEYTRYVGAGADDYMEPDCDWPAFAARLHALLRSRHSSAMLEPAEGVVQALARAVAAKDAVTGEHLRRLGELALQVGRQLGLEEPALIALRYAALLHDVGKIGIDDAILRKPGPLTNAEYAAIQQHPIIGQQIIQPLRLAAGLGPIVRGHHERWDGHGYPDGLAGESIPLGARIVAVLDAFDAMTSARPYADPLTVPDALARLQAGAGIVWDPEIVAALARCLASTGAERERAVGESLM